MRYFILFAAWALLGLFNVGCICCSDEPSWSGHVVATFTSPGPAAGKSEWETDNLRIRLAPFNADNSSTDDILLTDVRVENKRAGLAHIDAQHSCLVDPKQGAVNLFLSDQILPGGSFVLLHARIYAYISVTWGRRLSPPPTGTQRLLLEVDWEDGNSETVDVTYEVRLLDGTATSQKAR